MKKLALSILLTTGLMVGGGYALTQIYHVGVAQAQGVVDAGPPVLDALEAGSGSVATAPATPPFDHTKIDDPVENPSGFWQDLVTAKSKSWLGLVLVLVYALCRLLGRLATKFAKLSFFKRPYVAMVISGAATVAAGMVDALFMGGNTMVNIVVAGIYALIGWLGTDKAEQK